MGKLVVISESMGRQLEIWKKAYSFSHRWQVEQALIYAYSHPDTVYHVTENKFLKGGK